MLQYLLIPQGTSYHNEACRPRSSVHGTMSVWLIFLACCLLFAVVQLITRGTDSPKPSPKAGPPPHTAPRNVRNLATARPPYDYTTGNGCGYHGACSCFPSVLCPSKPYHTEDTPPFADMLKVLRSNFDVIESELRAFIDGFDREAAQASATPGLPLVSTTSRHPTGCIHSIVCAAWGTLPADFIDAIVSDG